MMRKEMLWFVWAVLYLLPLAELGLGLLTKFRPPQYGSIAYGFFSARAAKNQKIWDYAQQVFASFCLWFSGVSAVLITLVSFVLPLDLYPRIYINVAVGCVCLLLPYLLTSYDVNHTGAATKGQKSGEAVSDASLSAEESRPKRQKAVSVRPSGAETTKSNTGADEIKTARGNVAPKGSAAPKTRDTEEKRR